MLSYGEQCNEFDAQWSTGLVNSTSVCVGAGCIYCISAGLFYVPQSVDVRSMARVIYLSMDENSQFIGLAKRVIACVDWHLDSAYRLY